MSRRSARRPDTKIISDKDRVATSKAPQVNHDQLKKILDAGPHRSSGTDRTAVQQPAPAPQQVQHLRSTAAGGRLRPSRRPADGREAAIASVGEDAEAKFQYQPHVRRIGD